MNNFISALESLKRKEIGNGDDIGVNVLHKFMGHPLNQKRKDKMLLNFGRLINILDFQLSKIKHQTQKLKIQNKIK